MMEAEFGDDYAAYRRQVPGFIPASDGSPPAVEGGHRRGAVMPGRPDAAREVAPCCSRR